MSSLVLARKYRPRRFSDMVGQPHVVQALTHALVQQRLHHAWFFTGTRGVGKTTVSRILAKALNCTGPQGDGGITPEPCGQCPSCRDIDADRFVDYVEMDAASNRGIEDIRDLLERANYKPANGRFKVYMIDEVHQLTKESFNALLKTLEEPPEYLKFVLATTDPHKVPVTVLSRCLQFALRPIPPAVIQTHLGQVLAAESVAAEAAALALLARAARGSMRDALSLTDQAIAFGGGAVSEQAVRAMLGVSDASLPLRIIEALALGDGRAVVQVCDAIRTEGASATSLLEDIATILQRMAVEQIAGGDAALAAADAASDPGQAVPPPGLTSAADDGIPHAALVRLARLMPADETQLLYSLCLHGRSELALAPDEYAGLCMVLLRALAFKPTMAVAAGDGAEKKSLNLGQPRLREAPDEGHRPSGQEAADPSAGIERQARAPTQPHQWPASASGDVARSHGNGQSQSTGRAPALSDGSAPQGQRLVVRDVMRAAAPPMTGGPHAPADAADGSISSRAPAEASDTRSAPQAPGTAVALRVATAAPDELPGAAVGAEPTQLRTTAEGDFWAACVDVLLRSGAVTGLTRELALQAQLVARDENQWLVRVDNASLATQRQRLEAALQGSGHHVALAVEVGAVHDSPARRQQAQRAQWQRQALHLLTSAPGFEALARDFGARILPESLSIQPFPEESTPCSTKDSSPAS